MVKRWYGRRSLVESTSRYRPASWELLDSCVSELYEGVKVKKPPLLVTWGCGGRAGGGGRRGGEGSRWWLVGGAAGTVGRQQRIHLSSQEP